MPAATDKNKTVGIPKFSFFFFLGGGGGGGGGDGGNIVGISCPQEAFSKMDVIDYKHLLDVIFNGRRAHLVS